MASRCGSDNTLTVKQDTLDPGVGAERGEGDIEDGQVRKRGATFECETERNAEGLGGWRQKKDHFSA